VNTCVLPKFVLQFEIQGWLLATALVNTCRQTVLATTLDWSYIRSWLWCDQRKQSSHTAESVSVM